MSDTLTILHISDLHYSATDPRDTDIVLEALYKDIEHLRRTEGIHPDFVFFSGDLVNKGANADDFDALGSILSRILDVTALDRARLFVVPGNHDISRLSVESDPYSESGLETLLQSQSSLNSQLDSG